MIYIQNTIDKLEAYKEYLNLWLDDYADKLSGRRKNTITMFKETGILLMPNYLELPPFEIWYKIKTNPMGLIHNKSDNTYTYGSTKEQK